MYSVFKVSLLVHVVGSLYFSWLFCIYDDYSFFMTLYTFLSLRIRYLNVALMKYSNMNLDYVPDLLFFNGLFWKRRFDKLVTFHKRAGKLEFAKAFRIIFHQFDCINQGYRFALMLGVWTIVVGTFVSVQSFIIYIKNSLKPSN
ncbi:uncharacterized protein LOC101735652 isoform X3 [Bombyx mori]|uniref:uncharacterized protein LOC101735652 isoform X3 n=1 Tax=Bombyx mori TaxID=7091 RepID=UPI002ED0439A